MTLVTLKKLAPALGLASNLELQGNLIDLFFITCVGSLS